MMPGLGGKQAWRLHVLLLPSLILLTAFVIYPAGRAIFTSLTNEALTGPAAMHTRFVGFANYTRLLTDRNFWGALVVTFWFVLGSAVIGQFVLGMASAVILQKPFKLRPIVNAIILMPNAVPEVVAALLWASMLAAGDLGTMNKIVGLFGVDPQRWLTSFPLLMIIVVNTWRGIGFSMVLLTSGLSSISKDVYEAARMDGANARQIFTRITLPLMMPTVFLYMLISTVSTIAIFGLIFALTRGGPGGATEIIGIYIYNQAFNSHQIGYGSAIAVVTLAISLVLGVAYVKLLKVEV